MLQKQCLYSQLKLGGTKVTFEKPLPLLVIHIPQQHTIICNMCTCDLPDMYSQGPKAEGIHIRQIPHAMLQLLLVLVDNL